MRHFGMPIDQEVIGQEADDLLATGRLAILFKFYFALFTPVSNRIPSRSRNRSATFKQPSEGLATFFLNSIRWGLSAPSANLLSRRRKILSTIRHFIRRTA
jgi:hypothetical protein